MGVHTGDSITVAPADDALGPPVPGDARRGQGGHPQGRRGHGRLQHPVRRRAEDRPARRHRDEPARVALLGARLEGDGLPDREDRGAARGRLHARRDSQRHHEEDARLLRAVARLRRRQDPALDLREVPARRPAPDDPDEVGGRGDGDRADVRRGARQGDPVARDRARRPGRRRAGAAARGAARASSPRRPGSASSTCAGRSSRACSVEEIAAATRIDPWFLDAVGPDGGGGARARGAAPSRTSRARSCATPSASASRTGAIARATGRRARTTSASAGARSALAPVYKTIDTCAAEFEAETPYFYSTYEDENESLRTERRKVVVLGGGPNRIGQGIEFDYCCVHACYALSERGFETVMINCNPETVSTDYDTSDRLYFEPLTFEDVSAVLDNEKPDGILVQFGGQTPLEARAAARGGGLPDLGHVARVDRSRRGPRAVRRAARRARRCRRPSTPRRGRRARRSPRPGASAIRSWCARPTSSAGARWRSCSTTRT